ncbi:Serine protease [Sphaerulina musiva]
MLTHGMVSLLLHIVGAWSIPMPYDVPSAENHIPTNACDLPLSLSPPGSSSSLSPSPHDGRDNFTQLIHHADPELGLFSQAFLWNNTFWRPGAPIVLFLAGETSIDHYGIFSRPEFSTVGVIAQHLGAATIVLEHRYFGSSLPFRNFTKAHLQYLTVDNALKDVVRFAENFVAPWTDLPTTAQDVPWILIGGSYSAAQTGWIANIMPGTFWAYLSSSPILQAIPSYWAYFLPLMEHGDQSCMKLLSNITQFIDDIIESGDEESLQIIKKLFGLAEMKTSDFLYNLSFHWSDWGSIDLGQNYTTIQTYCAWILEGSEHEQEFEETYQKLFPVYNSQNFNNQSLAPRADWSLQSEQTLRALQTYAANFRKHLAPWLCIDGTCLDDTFAQLREPLGVGEMYEWLLCNDMMGGFVTGTPPSAPFSIVSRFLTYDYFSTRCSIVNSTTSSSSTSSPPSSGHPTAFSFNNYTGGWFPTHARRIIYTAGEMDVWREMSVSAKLRPGGPLESDVERDIVVYLVRKGWHHSELYTRNTELDEDVRWVRDREVERICAWVKQWAGYQVI